MHVIDQQTVTQILQKYPLDEQRLKVAVLSAKNTLQIIYDKVSRKYFESTKCGFFCDLLLSRCFSISGNSIATLIRNYYFYPDYNFSQTADSYFIIDASIGYESDIDIYFHDLVYNEDAKNTIASILDEMRKTYNRDSIDVFESNITIADNYTACTYSTKKIPEHTKMGWPVITDNAITMQDGTQLIVHSFGPDFNKNFDFEHCKMKYNGKNLYASKLQLICAAHKLILAAPDAQEYRLKKYSDRGFTVLTS